MTGQSRPGKRNVLELTVGPKQKNTLMSVYCLTVFITLEKGRLEWVYIIGNCRRTLLDSHRVLGAADASIRWQSYNKWMEGSQEIAQYAVVFNDKDPNVFSRPQGSNR